MIRSSSKVRNSHFTQATLFALLALSACGGGQSTIGTATGSADLTMHSLGALNLSSVVATISGPALPVPRTIPLSARAGAGTWGGLIGSLPVGSNYAFHVSAFDQANTVQYAGDATAIAIIKDQATTVIITAQQTAASAPFKNAVPVIDALVLSSSNVVPGASVSAKATAHDPNTDDTIAFAWSTNPGPDGFAPSNMATTVWTAPTAEGDQALTLTVTDNHGASTSASVVVHVSASNGRGQADVNVHFNNWPSVTDIVATPAYIVRGQPVSLTVLASDPDNDPLTYAWTSTCPSGVFSAATASATTFILPAGATDTLCALDVLVNDNRGGSTNGQTVLPVGAPATLTGPSITNSVQSVSLVVAGGTVTFAIEATDPQQSPLTFSWLSSAGALSGQTDAAGSSTVTWTAPATGSATFTVSAVVTDALGMSTRFDFAVSTAAIAAPTQIDLSIGGGATLGKSAMALNWVTNPSATSGEVIYSTSPDLAGGFTVAATVSTPAASDILPDTHESYFQPINAYKALLNNLVPGQTYYYKVGNSLNGYSSVRSFKAPASSDANAVFSFVVTPDTQGTSPADYQNTKDIYGYIQAHNPDAAFLVHLGDLVEDGYKSDQWQYFFDAAQPLLDSLPIMATVGNHDGGGSRDINNVQYTSRLNYSSLTTPSGLSAAAKGTIYSFEYGDALFVCLNSNLSGSDDTIQWNFLAAQSAATKKDWRIVVMHIPPYDPGTSHYSVDNETGYKLSQAGIDLVLDGHEHGYARTTLLTTDSSGSAVSGVTKETPESGLGTTYVVGGSVFNYAYGLNTTKDTSWNEFFYDLRTDGNHINSPGVYSAVDVSASTITYKAYYKKNASDPDLSVIDTFTLAHPRLANPVGGGVPPVSVTFLFDSFKQANGQSIARFNWITPTTTTATRLYYAKQSDFIANGGKYTNSVDGVSSVVDLSSQLAALNYTGGTASYTGTGDYSYAPTQSHKAETSVLLPGTRYVYCVGDGDKNITSVTTPASFVAPAADVKSYNFLFFTDAQEGADGSYAATLSDYAPFQKTLGQAVADYPDAAFIISGGDQVNYAFDTWEWNASFAANASIFAKYPFYMSTGNHECDGAGNSWVPGNSWTPVDQSNSEVLGHYNPPHNGAAYYGAGDGTQPMTSGVSGLEAMAGNYYFIYGDTLFLILDYQDSTLSTLPAIEQNWVKSVVKQNPTKWRVAVLHKTMFGYRVTNPTTGIPRQWTDTFDAAGIDLVMMGHDHLYARTKYYSGGAVTNPQTPGSGTTYITGASSNTDNRSASYKPNAYTLVNSTGNYGQAYVDIAISPDDIRVTTRGFQNGMLKTVEDNTVITNTPRSPNLASYSYPAVP